MLGLYWIHTDSSEQGRGVMELLFNSILVGAVDNVAESGCKGAIELNFGLVFLPADSVQVGVDERLHGVNVQ